MFSDAKLVVDSTENVGSNFFLEISKSRSKEDKKSITIYISNPGLANTLIINHGIIPYTMHYWAITKRLTRKIAINKPAMRKIFPSKSYHGVQSSDFPSNDFLIENKTICTTIFPLAICCNRCIIVHYIPGKFFSRTPCLNALKPIFSRNLRNMRLVTIKSFCTTACRNTPLSRLSHGHPSR